MKVELICTARRTASVILWILRITYWIFPKWSKFREFENYWSMNWSYFKDPISHTCLAGAVVASDLLHKRWLGGRFKPFYSDSKYFCHWKQWKHLGKTPLPGFPFELCCISLVCILWMGNEAELVTYFNYFHFRDMMPP